MKTQAINQQMSYFQSALKQIQNIIIPEEKSGIELLEELAASHCKECGCDLSDHRSTMNEEYCIDCYNEMHRQDVAFESQREK